MDLLELLPMKTVKWRDFKVYHTKYRQDLKLIFGDKSYFICKYHSPFIQDNAHPASKIVNGKKKKKLMRCEKCGRTSARVLFVIPFDALHAPGYYCYPCRKKNNMLDIDKAEKYGKVF